MRQASATGPSVVLHRETYTIAGSCLDQLQRAVMLLGPRRHGAVHPAYTDWEVRWSYAPDRGPFGARVVDPQVVAEVTCTLPAWRPPSSTPADLISRWANYVDALERHEQGHIDLARAAATTIHEALRTLPPGATEAALLAAAEDAVDAVLVEIRARERAYDEATGHGATQGVSLDGVQRDELRCKSQAR
jgi:predicted secreted Zn-dependent protease